MNILFNKYVTNNFKIGINEKEDENDEEFHKENKSNFKCPMITLKILDKFIENFEKIIDEMKTIDLETKNQYKIIWKDWLKIIGYLNLKENEINAEVCLKVNESINKFLKNYQKYLTKERCSLYFHYLKFHLVDILLAYGDISKFDTSVFELAHKERNFISKRRCKSNDNILLSIINIYNRKVIILRERIEKYLDFEKNYLIKNKKKLKNFIIDFSVENIHKYFEMYNNHIVHEYVLDLKLNLMKKAKKDYKGKPVKHLTESPFNFLPTIENFKKIIEIKEKYGIIVDNN